MSKKKTEPNLGSVAFVGEPPAGLPPPPSWQDAKTALADGNESLMRHCILWHGLPTEWLPILSLALVAEAELQEAVEGYKQGEWEESMQQRESFACVRPTSSDVESHATKRHKLDLAYNSAIRRRGEAEQADEFLAGLKRFFPEVFGDSGSYLGSLPPAVHEKICGVFGGDELGKTWRDVGRIVQPQPRRRLRTVGANIPR